MVAGGISISADTIFYENNESIYCLVHDIMMMLISYTFVGGLASYY